MIAFVASRGSNTATAAGTTFAIDLPAGASITPGNTLIASIAFRDTATPPTDPESVPGDSVAQDTRGNFWRRVGYSVNSGASSAADNGAVTHIWVCHVVFPYVNGDDVTFRAPITARPMTQVAGEVFEFSGVLRVDRVTDFELSTGNGTASAVATVTVPSAAGQLVFGSVAVATNPVLTGDADATNGAWSAISQNASAGIRRGSQYKIVTAAGAQTWDTTWAGAQQWAAAIVVMEVAPTSWPWNSAHLANPGYPCPAGPEILPTSRTITPIDTGTAYLFDCDLPPESLNTSSVYWLGDIKIPNDNVDVQHRVCVEVYERGAELARTDPFIFTLGTPNFVVANNGAMTEPGGSTLSANLVAALSGAGGEQVFLPDPGTPDLTTPASIDCYWDVSALLPLQDTHRILNLRLSYVAWKDDSAPAQPGEGLAVYWRDALAYSSGATSSATSLYGAWLVNDYKTSASRVYRNLGEVNGLPRLGANIGEQFANVQACWTIRDLLHMSTGDRSCMLSLFGLNGSVNLQDQIYLDTVRLDVFLVPETRLAQGVRRVTSGVGFPGNLSDQADGIKVQPMYAATDSATYWHTPAVATPITVAVREPIVASGSDWYSAQTDPDILTGFLSSARYSTQEAVGPSVVLKSLTQPRETLDPQVSVRRVEWSNGQVAPGAVDEPFGSMIQSVSLIDVNSYAGFWPWYIADNFIPDTARTGSTLVQDVGVDGVTTYDFVKLLVKPSDLTEGDLTVTVEKPAATVLATATLSVADCLALPDVGNGFREARLELNTAITPTAGTAEIHMASVNASNAGWIPGEAWDGVGGRFAYQANPAVAPVDVNNFAAVLCCPLADPDASLSTGTATSPITSDKCLTSTTDIPCVTIDNAADYDFIGISRVVGAEIVPITVIAGTTLGVEVDDTFTRTEVNEWGTADSGQVWQDTGTPYSVSGGRGRILVAAAGNANVMTISAGSVTGDQDATVQVGVTDLSTGGSQEAGIILRYTDLNNFYVIRARFTTSNTVTLIMYRMLAGVLTIIATTVTVQGVYTPGQMFNLRYQAVGTALRAKLWSSTEDEPGWQIVATDASHSTGAFVGTWGGRVVGNTNATPVLFDTFELASPTSLEWCDYGVPWDLISGSVEYLITGYRENDRAEKTVLIGPWAGSSVAPGAAFGLAGPDFLVSYVPVSESGPLQVTWSPLNPIESMPLAGKNYQIALRASEERGLSITVTVIADHLLRCEVTDTSITYDESLLEYDALGYTYDGETGAEGFSDRAPGGRSLSPSPYALIRSLENIDRLTLKLPGGHTRSVTLNLLSCVTTPAFGIYLAEIELVDTTVPGTYPYSAPGGEPIQL